MNNTKSVIFTLLAGATLGLASPVFADSYRHDRGYERGYDHFRHNEHFRDFDRHGYRGHDFYADRGYAHRPVFVARPYLVERPYYVQRPVIVEQPVYYGQSAPGLGLGASIGAALGSIIDNRY